MQSQEEPLDLKKALLNQLFYISHPSVSTLECSLNLKYFCFGSENLFEKITKEIIEMVKCNPEQVTIKNKIFTILFKDVAAIKLLNILFKGNTDHALYQIYKNWIKGSEWLSMTF